MIDLKFDAPPLVAKDIDGNDVIVMFQGYGKDKHNNVIDIIVCRYCGNLFALPAKDWKIHCKPRAVRTKKAFPSCGCQKGFERNRVMTPELKGKIRRMRARGLYQQEVADRLGISVTTVRRLERDTRLGKRKRRKTK